MMMGPSVTSETESEMKEYEEAPESLNEPRERLGLGLSLRDQEYLKHSSLFSRQQEDDQPLSGIHHPIHYFSQLVYTYPPSSALDGAKKFLPAGIITKGEGKLNKIGNCQKLNFAISLISCSTFLAFDKKKSEWELGPNFWASSMPPLMNFGITCPYPSQNRSHVLDERRIFSFFLVPSISMS